MPSDDDQRDDAFWREQQRRRERRFGQPCCTQSGMSWTMIDMPGDFAVVIHGESDCLNCFHHHIGQSAANYYCTRLTEAQLTSGATAEPLRRCLRLLAEKAPEAVIVLGTCPVEVIGDRFETTVEEVALETGLPMVALHTSGLALSTQGAMLDWLFETLASLPPGPRRDRRAQRRATEHAIEALFPFHARRAEQEPPDATRASVNLIGVDAGMPGLPEPVRLLERAGIGVNGVYPTGASIGDWRAIGDADVSFMTDPALFPKLTARLEACGQDVLPVPLPVGFAQSLALYQRVGQRLDVAEEVSRAIAVAVSEAEDALGQVREVTSGARLAAGIRMQTTYGAHALVYGGLGEVFALTEMGFDVELLVQGAPESADAFAEALAEQGCALPFRVFSGPWELGRFLADGDYRLCCLSDSSREEANKAGLSLIEAGSLARYLDGVVKNARLVQRLLV